MSLGTMNELMSLPFEVFLLMKLTKFVFPSPFPELATLNELRATLLKAGNQEGNDLIKKHPEFAKISYLNIDIPLLAASAKDSPATIQARLYSLSVEIGNETRRPVLIWFHAAGWILNSVAEDHARALRLVHESNWLLLSVEYHKAPEYHFPTPVYDAQSALIWTKHYIQEFGGDPNMIMIGGESSGANLAVAALLLNNELSEENDHHVPVKVSLLVYPPLNSTTPPGLYSKANGLLTEEHMEHMRHVYLGDNNDPAERTNPLFAPLFASDRQLSKLPPTVMVLSKFDILTKECEIFMQRLKSLGVVGKTLMYHDAAHGFFGRTLLTRANASAIRVIHDSVMAVNNFL